jgi:hypothetical protein
MTQAPEQVKLRCCRTLRFKSLIFNSVIFKSVILKSAIFKSLMFKTVIGRLARAACLVLFCELPF